MRSLAVATLIFAAMIWSADEPSIPPLTPPLADLKPQQIRDTFNEIHNGHPHEAIDIMAPAGTPVRAVALGTIRKLFVSKQGGNTVYEFDDADAFCYYYAHLDRYEPGLKEGMRVGAGQEIGFVGSTGNANPSAPHLHFAVMRIKDPAKWWGGAYVNPYSALIGSIQR
jgi:murein DD-endopeptidase MepM/ murein hydrolase activator NlpD